MNTSRRSFLKKSVLAAAGSTLFAPELLAAQSPRPMIAVQLYSVREEMKNDPLGTLKQVAAMGYKNLEHANYVDRKFYGYSPREFRKVLDDLGLKMPSGHTVLGHQHWNADRKEFTDAWKYTVEDAATLGQMHVVSPWMDKSFRQDYDGLVRFLEVFNRAGELCQKSGMKFGYHNHDFEFSESLNGKVLYDIILQNTDPQLVVHQLDIGNMVGGGGEAMNILKRYPGRFESMHAKDVIRRANESDKYESTILGKGLVPVKEVMEWGRKSGGTKIFIVEQEAYQGQAPLAAIKENLAVLKKWGYKA
jgi:sugar phosphate isomerase/epimerase